ncbi:MAG: GNAT family N-acetyltransferase [Lactobacillales bacterium]|jgi:ribosomal protein S18 acetylase RimI-like enzyme|nr:GNAT family N-acetyltransferase [Lactobacillales bacterium]
MNVELKDYEEKYLEELAMMMTEFQEFHDALFGLEFDEIPNDDDSKMLVKEWIRLERTIKIIEADATIAGFAVFHKDWSIVEIDNLYVKPELRHNQIATKALREIERIATQELKVDSVQLSVIPRNKTAFGFYQINGYIDLCELTIRKSFSDESPRDKSENVFGHDLNF